MKQFLLFSIIFFIHIELKAQVSTLNRPNDPVVLLGSQLTSFSTLTAGQIVGFKFVSGTWTQIPIQVDERALLDIVTPYGPNSSGNYTPSPSNPKITFYCDSDTYTGADANATFDSDDELVFMAKDAGGQSNGSSPSGIINGTCQEVVITDPLGGTGYVYLYKNGGSLQQSAGTSYVTYASNLTSTLGYPSNSSGTNTENTTITTSKYIWHFSSEWVSDKLQLIVGNNTDLLDRYKNFFSNGNCIRHEDAFSAAENAYVCAKAGPIRVIRSYMGAVSGPLTERTHLFYESRHDIATDLRVHNIVSVFDAFDYNNAANGMVYRNNLNTTGVTINGLQDVVTNGVLSWEQVSGTPGTISILHRSVTNLTASDGYFLSYYDDNATNPASNCTGDGQAWGTSGVGMHFNNGTVCTDPMNGCAPQGLRNITNKRIIYVDAPNGASTTASSYNNQFNNAFSVAISSCQTVSGYTINTSSNPPAGGNTSGGGTYSSGASVMVIATSNTGYTFSNWTENANIVSTNTSYNFTVTGNRNLVANFTLNTYTVTTSSNPVAGGGAIGGGTFAYGTSVTVNASSNIGYTFANWTDNGNIVSTNQNYSFTLTGNINLVANFTPNTYTVTTSSNPVAGGGAIGGGTFAYGTSVTVNASSNIGYTFANWTDNGNIVSTNQNYSFTLTGNINLVANFTPNTYTVTTSSNPVAGGGAIGGGNFAYGTSVTVNASSNTGYTFANWTENGNIVSTNQNYSFTLTGNINLVANFSPNNYTITTFSNPVAGGTTNGAGTFSYGTSVTVNATPNAGYTFTNWKENGNIVSTNSNYNFTVSGNRNLVANFTLNSYTITTSSNPVAGGSTTGGGTFSYGTSVTVNATSNTGYLFINWTENGNIVSTNSSYNFTISGNKNLVANFILTTNYNVTTSSNPVAGGTTTGGGNYPAGTPTSVTASPNTGYSFVNWTENGNIISANPNYNFTVTGNSNLVANFVLTVTYTITTSSNPVAGGNTNGGGTFAAGSSITVTASSNTGYTFVNWTLNGNILSTNPSYNFTVTGNSNLVANFVLTAIYTINTSSSPIAGGNSTGGGTFSTGTSVTVTATPNTGYSFVNWTVNGNIVSTNQQYNFIVSGNSNLVANFILSNYTIAISSNPVIGGSTTGGGVFNYGSTIMVTAFSNSGYIFDNWTENGNLLSTNPNYYITVTGNLNLVANFIRPITYTITTSSNPVTGGTVTGNGIYNSGAVVTLHATSNFGYAFFNWTVNGNILSTDSTYNFIIAADSNIVANFVTINSISEYADHEQIVIYPNPGNGYVNVASASSGTGTSTSSATNASTGSAKYDLKIYNSIGELIYSGNLPNQLTHIDLPYRGIYLFQFEKNGELVKTEKVIITN